MPPLAALLLVAAGGWLYQRAEGRLADARAAALQATAARQAAQRAHRLLAEYALRHRALSDLGALVGENAGTTEWPATLPPPGEGTARLRPGPVEPYPPVAGAFAQGAVARLTLPDEGALVAWLEGVRNGGRGLLRVEGCELQRRGEGDLLAECRLRRLFVVEREGAS
ncbi:hypothetical protein JCM17961_44140 [Endothiovibrio diazotrophicus]